MPSLDNDSEDYDTEDEKELENLEFNVVASATEEKKGGADETSSRPYPWMNSNASHPMCHFLAERAQAERLIIAYLDYTAGCPICVDTKGLRRRFRQEMGDDAAARKILHGTFWLENRRSHHMLFLAPELLCWRADGDVCPTECGMFHWKVIEEGVMDAMKKHADRTLDERFFSIHEVCDGSCDERNLTTREGMKEPRHPNVCWRTHMGRFGDMNAPLRRGETVCNSHNYFSFSTGTKERDCGGD